MGCCQVWAWAVEAEACLKIMAGSLSRRLNLLSGQLDHSRPATSPLVQSMNHSAKLSTTPSEPPSLRASASLIVIHPLQSITPDGFNYRTLLIKRNSTQRSFPAAHVFPGGNLDLDDHNHSQFLSDRSASRDDHKSDEASSDLQAALRVCAIRETFEETGILAGLLPGGVDIPSSILTDFRQQLKDQTTQFSKIIQHVKTYVPNADKSQNDIFCLDQLSHHANILTPTTAPKRWDTHFYLAILPSHTERMIEGEENLQLATPDQSETVSVTWLSPAEAIKRSLIEESTPEQSDLKITLPPPQFYLLTELARWKDYRQLMQHRKRQIFPLIPQIVKLPSSKGAFAAVFPGDPLHESSKELIMKKNLVDLDQKSCIHRIHVRNEASNFGSHPGNFFRPLKLQRSGVHHLFGNGWEDLD
ncbi:hypothetical protein MJO28_005021 [Puccinia striiformis f. sp. tritici]|uniref:Nudix hydrolase domain-containing protein n=3 Tax=Puccinia striiformis f. sp. tritici TaxID=168172 RepID=A0A0L0US76_9BASI|nr:hypothetical protein MJO28_005021 [Puccinia striiformis f. sp. tritici]KNE89835.1 hypothetical protein PSTG_16696 [Puccinia striiformis f. sp. tritici PST-78]